MSLKMNFVFCILYVLLPSFLFCKGENPSISVSWYYPRIVPYLENNHFDANMTIRLWSSTTINCFTLNSKNLKIKQISAISDIYHLRYTETIRYKVTYELIENEDLLKICLKPSLAEDTLLQLKITYSGQINEGFKGLSKVQYEEKGVKKSKVVLRLVPKYARTVFPCFDEPKYRSKLSLEVARFPNQTVTSITEILRTSDPDPELGGRVIDIFKTTKSMPIHKLSFVLRESESKSYTSPDLIKEFVSKLSSQSDETIDHILNMKLADRLDSKDIVQHHNV